MMENTVTIPREDYNILLTSQTRLDDIRLIIAGDKCTYGHYDAMTTAAIEALLGIERKEKTD